MSGVSLGDFRWSEMQEPGPRCPNMSASVNVGTKLSGSGSTQLSGSGNWRTHQALSNLSGKAGKRLNITTLLLGKLPSELSNLFLTQLAFALACASSMSLLDRDTSRPALMRAAHTRSELISRRTGSRRRDVASPASNSARAAQN